MTEGLEGARPGIVLPDVIAAYLRAYNAKDVPAMLDCLADDVVFLNVSGGAVDARADGKPSFGEMAAFGATAFSSRRQVVTRAMTVWDTTLATIAYDAVVARDLPNGWTAGQALSFQGASAYRVRDGKIVELVDQS